MTGARGQRAPGRPVSRWPVPRWADTAIIALAIAAMRIWWIGNPHMHVDEEFYLLVGGRMLDGALPYIDIWDRKPIGLFLIYAFAALFGNGVVAYQLMAMLSVLATAMIVYAMARRYADRPTAVLAAITYALLLDLFEGGGGQSPVFYNLLVTAAAAMGMRLFEDRDTLSRSRLVAGGSAIMALMGVAMQVKYSVVGEALVFGLMLQWLAWRRRGIGAALSGGLIWALLGLAPSGLAYLYYAHLGAGDIFLHANITSTLERGSDPSALVLDRLLAILRVMILPVAIGLWGAFARRPDGTRAADGDAFRFLLIWNGAAWLSFLAFGTYFPHYALALAAPVALLFAFATGRWLVLRGLIVIAAALAGIDTVRHDIGRGGGEPVIGALLTAMGRSPNCPYIYEGSAILYHLGGYCLPTRFAFPYHLPITREHDALGIDADRELARILSRNPYYIVVRLPFSEEHVSRSNALLSQALNARYEPVRTVRQWQDYSLTLFRLKAGFIPLPNAASRSDIPGWKAR